MANNLYEYYKVSYMCHPVLRGRILLELQYFVLTLTLPICRQKILARLRFEIEL